MAVCPLLLDTREYTAALRLLVPVVTAGLYVVDVVAGVDQRQCKVGGRVTFGCRVGESINEEW